MSLTGDQEAELTGGVLQLHLTDGSSAEIAFGGTANWVLDWSRSAPRFGDRMDLGEVDR